MPSTRRLRKPRNAAEFDRQFLEAVLPTIVEELRSNGAVASDKARSRAILSAMAAGADDVVAEMVKIAPRVLQRERSARRGFELRLARTWANGLDALAHLCTVYAEYGAEYYRTGFADDAIRRSALFASLLQLHGRSCRVAREVEALIRAGLPDGAFARWRTLHEVAVTAALIAQEGETIAERYLAHDIVKRYKLMNAHSAHAKALKMKPPNARDRAPVETAYRAAIAAYGASFKEEYGWAAPALQINKPNLAQIEKHVRLERFRPYYSWSSSSVHSGAHGFQGFGAPFKLGDSIPAGATNRGLADPGQNTAISLSQTFAALMSVRTSPFFTLAAIVLGKLAKRCQDAFIADSIEVERRTREARKRGEAKPRKSSRGTEARNSQSPPLAASRS